MLDSESIGLPSSGPCVELWSMRALIAFNRAASPRLRVQRDTAEDNLPQLETSPETEIDSCAKVGVSPA